MSSRLTLTNIRESGLTIISPVELGLNLDKIGTKLENSSFEAEFLPYQHIKSPEESASGKKFYKEKFKMAARSIEKAMKMPFTTVSSLPHV